MGWGGESDNCFVEKNPPSNGFRGGRVVCVPGLLLTEQRVPRVRRNPCKHVILIHPEP